MEKCLAGSATRAHPEPPTMAQVLRTRGATLPIPAPSGLVLAIYPSESSSNLKTADVTKAEMKKSINPRSINIQVQQVRRIGNAGVLVQTTSASSAHKFREAIPTTLRVTEPRMRMPLVAISGISGEPDGEHLIRDLHAQNLQDDANWSLERVKKESKIAFKKGRKGGATTTVVLECSAALRKKLVESSKVYLGRDVCRVYDYVGVTCCSKCQLYGHPEKYCRATEVTCGRCGNSGHRAGECSATSPKCARYLHQI